MNIVVVAGAGAGKTYALVQEYISALLGLHEGRERVPPSQILAVTFTEKAAAEMRTRVTSKLLQVARDKVFDDWMLERSQAFHVELPSASELRRMSRQLLSAPICTFHSFCSQIIREHADVAQIDPAFSLLAPLEENEIAMDIAEAVVIDALAENIFNVDRLVTRFQLRKFGDSKGLCDNLVSLYYNLSEHGISPVDMQPSSLVFVENWSTDQEIVRIIGQIKSAIGAFRHTKLTSNAADRLNKCEEALHLFQQMLHQEDDLEVRLAGAYKELRSKVSGRFGHDDLRKDLVQAIVSLGCYLCTVFASRDAQTIWLLLERFFSRLDAYKLQFGVLGFGDLLKKARFILRENLDVRKTVQRQFRRILVDEFQDTSPLQEDLVALLCEDPQRAMRLLPNERAMSKVFLRDDVLFVVGDPKQSIYGFRGADVQLFNHTLNTVTQGTTHQLATGKQQALQLCRRSQGSVVDLVNLVGRATLNSKREGVTFGPQDCLSALKPAHGVAGAIWKADILSLHHKESAIADVLAWKVKELIVQENAHPRDIVVLVRRIKSALPIVLALQKFGVSARIYGGEGFFARTEVIDVLAALQLSVDEDDELATLTVLRSPFVALSDADLMTILGSMENWQGGIRFSSIINALENAPLAEDVKKRARSFAVLIREIRAQLGSITVGQAIDRLLLDGHYALAIAIEPDADDRLANILKLRAMCIHYLSDAPKRIHQLWQRLDNPPKESLAENIDADDNAVRLMTIHQSKGLEYRFVILADTLSSDPNDTDDVAFSPHVGLAVTNKGRPIAACAPQTQEEKQSFPTPIDLVRQQKRKASEAELARLLYVALTRAKERIFFMDVQVDQEKVADRGVTLRRLFYLGRDLDPKQFDTLMPTEITKPFVQEKLFSENTTNETRLAKPELFLEQPICKKRISPSQAALALKTNSTAAVKNSLTKPVSAKIGSLAHRLIAMVGLQITMDSTLDEIVDLLNASVRAMGWSSLDPEIEMVVESCTKTLDGFVRRLLCEGYQLQFEAAIFLEQEDTVLEGFADLVAFSSSKCVIVDFKSSTHAARSQATKIQLRSYASALRPRVKTPLFMTACVIGQSSSFDWIPYDVQLENASVLYI